MPELTREGDVFVLDIGSDENRFHPDWMSAVTGALDEVIAAPAPRALVTTATGKIWSNGLDLDWLGQNQDKVEDYVAQVHELFARFLAAPVPTVAAIQGHAFAAGAMLTLAHDWRVMRADRGFWCLPEADIHIPFTPGMSALIQSKLTPATATASMLTARRYGGDDALAAGIVDAAVPEGEVLGQAVAIAAEQAGKDGGTIGTIKSRMYAAELEVLGDREANRLLPG